MRKVYVVVLFVLLNLQTRASLLQLAGLNYREYAGVNVPDSAPLLILLHGLGSNEEDLLGFAPALPSKYRIISVRAPYVLGDGSYAWFHVNFATGNPVHDSLEAEQSRVKLTRFLASAQQKYKASACYLLGFSQGAIMSFNLALTQPKLVKGIVALSGRVLPETIARKAPEKQLKRLKVFIGHGTRDNVLPIKHGRISNEACKAAGVQLTYKEYVMGHEINKEESRDIVSWLDKQE